MRNEELVNYMAQTELIKAVAHLRAAQTLEYYRGSNREYLNDFDKAIKAVEDLIA